MQNFALPVNPSMSVSRRLEKYKSGKMIVILPDFLVGKAHIDQGNSQ